MNGSETKGTAPGKIMFLLGLFIGISVLSTIGFIFSLSLVLSNKHTATTAATNTNTNGAVAGAQDNTNTTAEPVGDPSKLSPVTDADHIRGDKNASVTLIEFSDFECPYCAALQATLTQLLTDYSGKIRLVFRNYPLSFHANAEKAAEAAECASEQGKFWEMHDKIYAANTAGTTMSVDLWKKTAADLGLNTTQFNNCLDQGKYAQKIKDQLAEGTAAGVQGTPATFINGTLVSGAVPIGQFKTIIDGLLK